VQFASGLIEETKNLKEKYGLGLPALSSFGYEDVDAALRGKISFAEAAKLNQQRSRNYARRQMTWWKREKDILWFSGKML
jgi:tRNA dimethylallyltransferase